MLPPTPILGRIDRPSGRQDLSAIRSLVGHQTSYPFSGDHIITSTVSSWTFTWLPAYENLCIKPTKTQRFTELADLKWSFSDIFTLKRSNSMEILRGHVNADQVYHLLDTSGLDREEYQFPSLRMPLNTIDSNVAAHGANLPGIRDSNSMQIGSQPSGLFTSFAHDMRVQPGFDFERTNLPARKADGRAATRRDLPYVIPTAPRLTTNRVSGIVEPPSPSPPDRNGRDQQQLLVPQGDVTVSLEADEADEEEDAQPFTRVADSRRKALKAMTKAKLKVSLYRIMVALVKGSDTGDISFRRDLQSVREGASVLNDLTNGGPSHVLRKAPFDSDRNLLHLCHLILTQLG